MIDEIGLVTGVSVIEQACSTGDSSAFFLHAVIGRCKMPVPECSVPSVIGTPLGWINAFTDKGGIAKEQAYICETENL